MARDYAGELQHKLDGSLDHERRVDLTTADLASGGAIPTQSLPMFLSKMYNATPLLGLCSKVEMRSPTMNLPALGIGRILKKDYGGEAAEVPSAKRVKPTASNAQLVAKKWRGEVPVSYDYLEDNIEKEGFQQDLLMNHIAPRVGVDLIDLALNGDTTTVEVDDDTGALSVADGWLAKITSNVLDCGGSTVDTDILLALYKKVPARYIDRNPTAYAFIPARDVALDWAKKVADRMTVEGDRALSSGGMPRFFNREVIADANIRADGTGKQYAIFTDPKNLVLGIHRDIRIRVVDWPIEEKVRVLVSVRADFQLFLEDAAAKATNLGLLTV